jgi:hypothetical protein
MIGLSVPVGTSDQSLCPLLAPGLSFPKRSGCPRQLWIRRSQARILKTPKLRENQLDLLGDKLKGVGQVLVAVPASHLSAQGGNRLHPSGTGSN